MKILTWNIYRHNKSVELLFAKTRELSPDLICFQEVQESLLPLLEKYFPSYRVYKAKQFFNKKDKKSSVLLYNVTLSKLEVVNSFNVKHDGNNYSLPRRYRKTYTDLDLEFLAIDYINKNGDVCRLFNVHLECVAPPSLRAARLRQVYEHFIKGSTNNNIIVGDFNSFLSPIISLFVAPIYSNYKKEDYFCFERELINQNIKQAELQNPFKGVGTFKFYWGQYDYILIPKNYSVITKIKSPDYCGSDHCALMIEV